MYNAVAVAYIGSAFLSYIGGNLCINVYSNFEFDFLKKLT